MSENCREKLRGIPPYSTLSPLKLRIAFQGGGAKLVYLMAACEVIYDYVNKGLIEISGVSGTSAGAIAAIICAAKIPPNVFRTKLADFPLEEIGLNKIDLLGKDLKWYSNLQRAKKYYIYFNVFWRNKPIIKSGPIRRFLEELLKESEYFSSGQLTFGQIPIDAYVVASDLGNRGKKIFGSERSDNVVEALLASIAIPFVFRGPDDNLNALMDGGFVSNLPVDAFDLKVNDGSRVIAIALDCGNESDVPAGALSMVRAMLDTAIQANVARAETTPCTTVIKLNAQDISLMDFTKAQKFLKDGGDSYEAARKETETQICRMLDDMPPALSAADHRYSEFIRNGQVSRATIREYRRIRASYTHLEAVEEMQRDLVDLFDCLVPEGCKAEDKDGEMASFYNTEPGRADRFDAVLRPEIAIADEVFYLFPFFLSYLRQISWGVIPYAKQVALGILIHKTHPAYDYLSEQRTSLVTPPEGNWPPPIHAPPDDQWFGNLVPWVHRENGRIWALKGYLFHEVLPLLLRKMKNELAQKLYERVLCVLDPQTGNWHCRDLDVGESSTVTNRAEVTEIIPSGNRLYIPNAMQDQEYFARDIMVVDLAHRHLIHQYCDRGELDEDYELIPVVHALDIDVGIGFSLVAVPLLKHVVQKDPHSRPLWRILRDCAVHHLQGDRADLLESGILLDSFSCKS